MRWTSACWLLLSSLAITCAPSATSSRITRPAPSASSAPTSSVAGALPPEPPSDAALVEAVKALELTQLPFPGPATDGTPGPHPLGDSWGVQLLRRFSLASASYAVLLFGDGRAMGIVVGKESVAAPLFQPLTGYFAEFGGLGVTEAWLGDLIADDHQAALLVFQETTTTGHPDPNESARLRALLLAPAGARELTLPTTLPERATVQARAGGSSVVETCRAGHAQIYRFDFATSTLVKQGTEPCHE